MHYSFLLRWVGWRQQPDPSNTPFPLPTLYRPPPCIKKTRSRRNKFTTSAEREKRDFCHTEPRFFLPFVHSNVPLHIYVVAWSLPCTDTGLRRPQPPDGAEHHHEPAHVLHPRSERRHRVLRRDLRSQRPREVGQDALRDIHAAGQGVLSISVLSQDKHFLKLFFFKKGMVEFRS